MVSVTSSLHRVLKDGQYTEVFTLSGSDRAPHIDVMISDLLPVDKP